MGWDYTNRHDGETLDEFFSREFNTTEFIGKGAFKNFKEYYRAFKRKNGEITCMIVLVDTKGDGYFNIGYKDMTETMLPYYFNCPKRILDLLSPTNDENALKWREECRKRAKPIKDGTIVKIDQKIKFMNGAETDTFLCQKIGRKTYWHIYIDGKPKGMCDFNPRSYNYEIL